MDTIRKLPTQIMTTTCANKMIAAGVVGATMAYTGVGTKVFPAPAIVHMALGGVLVDVTCRAVDMANGMESAAKHAMYAGVAGGATLMLTGAKPNMLLM